MPILIYKENYIDGLAQIYYTVYRTTNTVNGKTYIGKHATNEIADGYLGSGKSLKRAIRYYGKDVFKTEILFTFNREIDASNKERELVNEEFVARKDTYNEKLGGQGGWDHIDKKLLSDLGKSMNEKLKNDPEFQKRRKKRSAETWKKAHAEGKMKYDNFKGKKHSTETKMKIGKSNKQKGYNNSQFGTCWITNEIESRKIMKGDLIPEGWRLGRKM